MIFYSKCTNKIDSWQKIWLNYQKSITSIKNIRIIIHLIFYIMQNLCFKNDCIIFTIISHDNKLSICRKFYNKKYGSVNPSYFCHEKKIYSHSRVNTKLSILNILPYTCYVTYTFCLMYAKYLHWGKIVKWIQKIQNIEQVLVCLIFRF